MFEKTLKGSCPSLNRNLRLLSAASLLACLPSTVVWAEEAPVLLPEIVVSASSVPLPAEQIGSAVTVITAEEIERKQVRILSDVLREVPGLAVNRSGTVGTLTQVRIRGAEGNQTLVIIDGVEVNDPSAGSEFDFGNVLASDIERIEVLRGPQSALYGSDAIGGVINIITKKGSGPATASLSVEGGSFRTGQATANLRGGGEWYHYSLGATGFSTDGVSIAPESEGNSEEDGHRNQTYNAKLGISPIDNLEIELFGRYVKSVTDTDAFQPVSGVFRSVDSDSETRTTQRSSRARVKYSLLEGNWEHIVSAALNQAERDSYSGGALTSEIDGEKAHYDYQSNFFFDTPTFAEAEHRLTLLIEREDEAQRTASAFSVTDLDITNYGFVGEYGVGLWDRLFLSSSLRYDNNDIFDDETTFRATAAYLHQETATRLHGSYGTGVKNPTLFELFGSGPNFIPNPDLSPETSKGWDIGVEQGFFDDRLSIDVTYFNNRITDLIQGSGLTAVNLNGTSKIDGLEVSARAELLEGLNVRGQYTYTNGQDANGVELVRRAKHLASANLAYDFLEGRAKLDLGVDFNGEQRDSQFVSVPLFRRNNVTLDDFILVNVAGSYEVIEGIEVYGRVENLFDEDYEEVLGFDSPGVGAFLGVRATVALE